MRKFLGFLIIFLFSAICPVYASSHYLNELDAVRPFASVPIKIWVQDSAYQSTIYSAFAEWNRASGNCVRFVHANSEMNAQIRVYFVKTLVDHAAGMTFPWTTPDGKYTTLAEIKIAIYPVHSPKPITKQQAFQVAVHEIGHAIGLYGHSSNRNDIMYPDTSIIGIYASARDYASIRTVYCKR